MSERVWRNKVIELLEKLVAGLTPPGVSIALSNEPGVSVASSDDATVMTIDYAALKSEILTDPVNVGYAPFVTSGQDQAIADLLNAKTGNGVGQVPREPISAADFIAAINATEMATLTALQLTQVQIIAGASTVNIGDSDVQAWVSQTFGQVTAPNTRTTLTALATRIASRAEVLFGAGTRISSSDVSFALRGTR